MAALPPLAAGTGAHCASEVGQVGRQSCQVVTASSPRLLGGHPVCPRADMMEQQVLESGEMRHTLEQHKELLAYLSEKSGRNVDSVVQVGRHYSFLYLFFRPTTCMTLS